MGGQRALYRRPAATARVLLGGGFQCPVEGRLRGQPDAPVGQSRDDLRRRQAGELGLVGDLQQVLALFGLLSSLLGTGLGPLLVGVLSDAFTGSAHPLARALETLMPVLDIIEGRVDDGVPPAWCEARGWTPFLLSLDTAELSRCEEQGLLRALADVERAPPDLLALARRIANRGERTRTLAELAADRARIEAQIELARENASIQGRPLTIAGDVELASGLLDYGSASADIEHLEGAHTEARRHGGEVKA